MKFGKVTNPQEIIFSLPAEPAWNRVLLDKASADKLQVYLGCTGWRMPAWKGRWYPEKAKTNDLSRYYGEQFNTIEFNTTHYRIPSKEQAAKWCEAVPTDFRFCPKVPQTISHSKTLGLSDGAIEVFCEALGSFGEKLGCSFMQLPPYFGADRLGVINRFLENWPKAFPLAIEARHQSWFVSTSATLSLIELLAANNVSGVMTDVAGRRDVLHGYLSNNRTMIRFVGNGLIASDFQRADRWCERILHWHKLGLKEAYLFPHQRDNLLAPEMTQYFFEQLSQHDEIAVRGPSPIEEDNTKQMTLF